MRFSCTCADSDSFRTGPTKSLLGASCLQEYGPAPPQKSSLKLPDPEYPPAAAGAPSLGTLPVLSVEKGKEILIHSGQTRQNIFLS